MGSVRFPLDRFDPSVFGDPCYDLDSREGVLQRRYFTINVPLMSDVLPDQMSILVIFQRLRACFDSFRKLFHGYGDVSNAPKRSHYKVRARRHGRTSRKKKCAPKGALK